MRTATWEICGYTLMPGEKKQVVLGIPYSFAANHCGIPGLLAGGLAVRKGDPLVAYGLEASATMIG